MQEACCLTSGLKPLYHCTTLRDMYVGLLDSRACKSSQSDTIGASECSEAGSAIASIERSLESFLCLLQCLLQDKILEILLRHVDMEAVLSLEPIFMLVGALARDLQADFLPYLPEIFSTYADLVDKGGQFSPQHSVKPSCRKSSLALQNMTLE